MRLKPEHAGDLPVLLKVLESLPLETTIVRNLDRFGSAVVRLPQGADVAEAVAEIRKRASVASVEPHYADYTS